MHLVDFVPEVVHFCGNPRIWCLLTGNVTNPLLSFFRHRPRVQNSRMQSSTKRLSFGTGQNAMQSSPRTSSSLFGRQPAVLFFDILRSALGSDTLFFESTPFFFFRQPPSLCRNRTYNVAKSNSMTLFTLLFQTTCFLLLPKDFLLLFLAQFRLFLGPLQHSETCRLLIRRTGRP